MSALRQDKVFHPGHQSDFEQYQTQSFQVQQFTVYSTTPEQRFIGRLRHISKVAASVTGISFIGAAVMQFCLLGVEMEVSRHFETLEVQLKNREDLKSYLGHAYSWRNLDHRMQQMRSLQANMLEINTKTKSIDKVLSEAKKENH